MVNKKVANGILTILRCYRRITLAWIAEGPRGQMVAPTDPQDLSAECRACGWTPKYVRSVMDEEQQADYGTSMERQRCRARMDIEGGTIKLLVYEGNHVTNHFYYEWVPLAKWKVECKSNRERVQCNGSVPIFWKEKAVLGNYDIHEQKASFAVSDSFVEIANLSTLGEMSVLVRNTNGGPPECTCAQCSSDADHASKNQLMVNDWGDFCCGNLWPADKPIMRALNRPLNTPRGPQDHFVALWYRHGKPLMGRAWNDDGKINASFVDSNHEFSGKIIGSLQMLVAMQATAAGFEYCWLPYEQASRYIGKDFAPVHMSYVAPCVIQVDKFEILGSVNLKKERAEASFDGRIITLDGPAIRTLKVLCRKDRDDTMVI
ncbi:hypothetical protein NECAME_00965 [Necator americanus]|uniref:Uncharacterized protein n=1 Tax=Necator americanus TaxID=51031 RepID=W2SMS4_NECAM|nr:hypothetical protein NECAME_00965 [Necator americanus]ETN70017.1 hypothetical protein NECAME_00965 [Necator americanus]